MNYGDPRLPARFWAKVQQGDCWIWTGYCTDQGYGRTKIAHPDRRYLYVHRVAYELAQGRIPDGWTVEHGCRNRACINPGHLNAVPWREDSRRRDIQPTARKPVWLRIVNSVERDEDGCWIWQKRLNHKGYSVMRVDAKTCHGARVSYEAFRAPIPDGLQVDHLCCVKSCVNPFHLEPVTNQENSRRRRALATECPSGHPFVGDNLIVESKGASSWRRCRICTKAASARAKAKARANQRAARLDQDVAA